MSEDLRVNLWFAPPAPCPLCEAQTRSDGISREYAEQERFVDMTYTCQRCHRLFIKRVDVKEASNNA